MTSDWWFLAMLGSAAATAGSAIGSAASAVGSGIGSAAGAIGSAAKGALGLGAGGAGAGTGAATVPGVVGAAPTAAAPAAAGAGASIPAGGAGGLGIPASEAAPTGTGAVLPNAPSAAAVPTSNLPPAAGGTQIAAQPASAPAMGGGSDPFGEIMGKVSPGSGTPISTVSMPQTAYGAQPKPPLMAAQGPGTSTLGELTNMPELGQASAGAQMAPTPTTFQLPGAQGGPGAPPPGGGLLSQLGTGFKNQMLQGVGVTNPQGGLGSFPGQMLNSAVAGGPYFGQPGASFLQNLWGAGKQRLLTTAFGQGGGGQAPQNAEQLVSMLLARNQGPPARQLPVYNTLPGGNQFSW